MNFLSYLEFSDSDKISLIRKFMIFCVRSLEIENSVEIVLTDEKLENTFATYYPELSLMKISIKNRHLVDIMRRIAHELKHHQQSKRGENLTNKDGSPTENDANIFSGIVVRKFGRLHPEIFE